MCQMMSCMKFNHGNLLPVDRYICLNQWHKYRFVYLKTWWLLIRCHCVVYSELTCVVINFSIIRPVYSCGNNRLKGRMLSLGLCSTTDGVSNSDIKIHFRRLNWQIYVRISRFLQITWNVSSKHEQPLLLRIDSCPLKLNCFFNGQISATCTQPVYYYTVHNLLRANIISRLHILARVNTAVHNPWGCCVLQGAVRWKCCCCWKSTTNSCL